VPRYLSPEWFTAAQTALDASTSLKDASKGVAIDVQHLVTGAPDGDLTFHVHVNDGTARIDRGETADPTVTFIESWDTAKAIAQGELSAQGAFMTGLIRVRGDLPKLVEHSDAFGGVDDVFASLRADTTY